MQCLIFIVRYLFQNMIYFNGFCGCLYCYVLGEFVQISDRGYMLIYLLNCENFNEYFEFFIYLFNIRNGVEVD